MKHVIKIACVGFLLLATQAYAQSSPGCYGPMTESLHASSGMIAVNYPNPQAGSSAEWMAVARACRIAGEGCLAGKTAAEATFDTACDAHCAQGGNPACVGNSYVSWGECVQSPAECTPGPLDFVSSATGTGYCSCNNWSQV
jgi:hypothetical protein